MLFMSSSVDSSGGTDNAILMSKDSGEMYRTNFGWNNTAWGSAVKMLDANNYNSYAPKLDGTGATGTWPIGL